MKKESTIILGIHGLGSKPPKELLENWWKQAIEDGLRLNGFSKLNFDFELIYWADILHTIPLDFKGSDKTNPLFFEKYTSEEYPEQNGNLTFREKAFEYFEKYYSKFIVNEVLSFKYPSLTEFFIHLHLRDLKTYFSNESIHYNGNPIPAKEAIVDHFIKNLNKHKNKKIFLVAHSMGSIIVLDALSDCISEANIDTLVTIGSPLGQKYVISKYKTENEINSINKFKVPENIVNKWYNLSDFQDQVALNHEISDLYEKNSLGIKIEDQLVKNKFVSEGIRNPHKAFGYLRTPEFSKIINGFLTQKKPGVFERIIKFFSRI
ncbi:MAG: alpha/beta hydrolase [Ignavibacteriales bacterium]|nr:alpha/beta hydrolase [Ignavibacteriales bacterium]